jgi:hypothetical protein
MTPLLDESTSPSLRSVLARLLGAATFADFAVARVRLAAIDLTATEASAIGRCRFLLGRLEAEGLSQIAAGAGRQHLLTLHDLLTSGRIEIRSAGMSAWLPDFSVFRGLRGTDRDVCVFGAHYFRQPPVAAGPSLTCILTGAHAVDLATRRFTELWDSAHDVQSAVLETVDRMLDVSA